MEPPTIVLRRKLTTAEAARAGKTETLQKVGAGKNNQGHYDPTKQRKLDVNDIPNIPKVTPAIAQTIRDARASKTMPDGKTMTQSDLAKQCHMQTSIIAGYETGNTVPTQDEINKINKALGTQIKIPKAKKPVVDE